MQSVSTELRTHTHIHTRINLLSFKTPIAPQSPVSPDKESCIKVTVTSHHFLVLNVTPLSDRLSILFATGSYFS